MIISSLVEESGADHGSGAGESAGVRGARGIRLADDDQHEYQTANQLFELMAQDHNFDTTEDDSLSQRDLVLIYKNLDLGTQLMSNANEFKRNRPNQYVETVVYKDEEDSDSSEFSEMQYSSEDLHNMVLINKERIDLLNCGSGGNTLCNKLGDIRVTTSSLNSEYKNHCFYNNAYLKNFNSDDNSMLPDSLLDYICCKRLEDNYNFYMDSIIIYVKHTIDQLRRISEGDYLTDKVKERWREVDSKDKIYVKKEKDTKVLATCTSIPLQIERKLTGSFTKWEDIVHSEVDVRSLSKIIEKKIVFEVPKVICDSYELFSKCCANNLVISCKKQKKTEASEKVGGDARVDVVFKLKPSESGQVISNISSVMILHTAPALKLEVDCLEPLPIAYKSEDIKTIDIKEDSKDDKEEKEAKVIDIAENYVWPIGEDIQQDSTDREEDIEQEWTDEEEVIELESTKQGAIKQELIPDVSDASEIIETLSVVHVGSHGDAHCVFPYEKINVPQSEPTTRSDKRENAKILTADLLSMTIQRLNQNALSCMPEESEEEFIFNVPFRKKPPAKRIKSPYENKAFLIEEKKRKHLLEMRQKREKKKKAMGLNNNVNVHKYGVDSMAPRASSSITQISISNKSFYNSIFGKASSESNKQVKNNNTRKFQKSDSEINKKYNEADSIGDSSSWKTESSDKKKYVNYDLDDVETEIMQTTDVKNESMSSADYSNKFNYSESYGDTYTGSDQATSSHHYSNPRSMVVTIPIAKRSSKGTDKSEKVMPALECRKNISKIYDLVQKLGKSDCETKPTKSKFTAFNNKKSSHVSHQDHKIDQLSDSTASLRNYLPSSNPSLRSVERKKEMHHIPTKKEENLTVTSPKSQIPRYHARNKEAKSPKPSSQSNNPLKAISDLIHNIDNLKQTHVDKVAKSRAAPEAKPDKKQELNCKEQETRKRNFRLESPDKHTSRKPKPLSFNNQIGIDKDYKNKLSDIIDEQKEARGEAVKGPSTISRIDALAQPKRAYVQAHREEIMAKTGRRWSPQKPASSVPIGDRPAKTSAPTASRQSRNLVESISRRGYVSPTPPARLERQRSPPVRFPARTPASLSPPRSPMTSWVVSDDHRQAGRRHAKAVPDPIIIKKETKTVKHVSYEDPVITGVRTRSPSPRKYLERGFQAPNIIEINPNLGETVQAIVQNMPSTTFETVTDFTETVTDLTETVTDLTEASESNFGKHNCFSEPVSLDCTYSITSDHEMDIFEDKTIVTEVQVLENRAASELDKAIPDILSSEMRKLEHALNRQKLEGNFQKRLRLKNLTLKPESSLRKMFVLQSGDAESMFFQANSGLNVKSMSDVHLINDVSKRNFKWSLSNIPLQVNTIGYAFTNFKSVQCGPSNMKFNSLCSCSTANEPKKSDPADVIPEKNCQCSSTSDLGCHLIHLSNNSEKIHGNDSQVNKVATAKMVSASTNMDQHESFLQVMNNHIKSDVEVKSNPSAGESNSLDVLVGLLNEIQKITTCQTNITNTFQRNTNYETAESNDLENLLKEAAIAKIAGCVHQGKHAGDNPLHMLSITSLEKLRQLESDPSLYSLYISNIDDFIERNNSSPVSMKSENTQPLYKDEEVSVNIPKKEYISRVTDVPSTLLTLSLNKSTDVSESLCRMLEESSTLSKYSTQHHPIYMNSNYQCCHCIVDVPKNITEQNFKRCHLARFSKIKELPEHSKATSPMKLEKTKCVKEKKDPPICDLTRKISDYCNESSELDHVMKIKRDVLVTVYSILVFTVFAALSFPAELV